MLREPGSSNEARCLHLQAAIPAKEWLRAARALGLVASLAVATAAFPAHSAPILLDFEGVGNSAAVGSFYDGGGGGSLGITFGAGALGLIDADAGGTGQFGNEPSPNTVVLIATAANAFTVDVSGGFDTGISFYYANLEATIPVTANVYSGAGGTGSVLATTSLGQTPGVACDPGGIAELCNFIQVGVPFAGVAQSVVFGGRTGFVVFDDIAFGTVPEPGTGLLVGLGLVAMAVPRHRSRARAYST